MVWVVLQDTHLALAERVAPALEGGLGWGPARPRPMAALVALVQVVVVRTTHQTALVLAAPAVSAVAVAEVTTTVARGQATQVALAVLAAVVVKGATEAALAAPQSSASTTKGQSCTTHLLNPTL